MSAMPRVTESHSHAPHEAAEVPSARTAVRIDGVGKSFGDSVALHPTTLRVQQGEFMTLLGPSGCGKTTLLNLVAGFLAPDAGEIFVDDELVTNTPAHQREIGIVFQNYALFPHMTVARNVGYGLRMRGIAKDEIARRVAQALKMVKLVDYGERRPRELSGGQQQRVALARALVIQPKVLLLDEPFSALDKNLRGDMQVELKEIQRSLGVTTIFVTHDQGEALSMSDRIAVMSQGRVRQIATPDEIYRRPRDRFVASFVGDVNVLPARLDKRTGSQAWVELDATRAAVPADTLGEAAAGDRVDLFVRPEHLGIGPVGPHSALTGTVVRHVFQGGHVDIYVDVPAAGDKRILVRSPGTAASARLPVGAPVGLTLPEADELVAFAAERA